MREKEIADDFCEHRLEGGRPTDVQRRYLERGLGQPGGKLPLFDREGRQVPRQTVESCIAHGWAEPWFANPIKPEWLGARGALVGKNVASSGKIVRG